VRREVATVNTTTHTRDPADRLRYALEVYRQAGYSFAQPGRVTFNMRIDTEAAAMVHSELQHEAAAAGVGNLQPAGVGAGAVADRGKPKVWRHHPEREAGRETEVGGLRTGDRFRSDNYDGTWTWGTVMEEPNQTTGRVRVKLDGGQQQVVFSAENGKERRFEASGASTVNWPVTVRVEKVTATGNGKGATTAAGQDPAERRWTMNSEAQEKAIRARYQHQVGQLAKAREAGDEGKAEVVEAKVAAIVTEAEALGINLAVEAKPVEAVVVAAKGAKAKVTTVGKGKVEVKEETEDRAAKLKEANAERLAALRQKKAAQKEAKPKKEKKMEATRDCLCGCGTETGGRFAAGHDARVKGLLLKVERGDEPKSAINETLAQYVKFAGKSATAGKEGSDFRIAAAPVRFPGRPEIAYTEV
jgi:hypothetical protein